jgi:hypothetical protein
MIDGWIKIKPTHKFGSYQQQEIATERESNSLIVIRNITVDGSWCLPSNPQMTQSSILSHCQTARE